MPTPAQPAAPTTPTLTISAKRLAANRANARKSTGPRTPEGKARSARNHTKHGLYAAQIELPEYWQIRAHDEARLAAEEYLADPALAAAMARRAWLHIHNSYAVRLFEAFYQEMFAAPDPLVFAAASSARISAIFRYKGRIDRQRRALDRVLCPAVLKFEAAQSARPQALAAAASAAPLLPPHGGSYVQSNPFAVAHTPRRPKSPPPPAQPAGTLASVPERQRRASPIHYVQSNQSSASAAPLLPPHGGSYVHSKPFAAAPTHHHPGTPPPQAQPACTLAPVPERQRRASPDHYVHSNPSPAPRDTPPDAPTVRHPPTGNVKNRIDMGNSDRTSRAAEFRTLLGTRAMVADGAMGTMLYTRGIFINRCFDELNLSAPDMVKEIHQEYVRAGAEIVETNTFGATRARLATFGLGEKTEAINRAGVRIARAAAAERGDVFVAGAVGPLGLHVEPLGPTSLAEARQMFREQVDALVAEGVDLLIFETFSSLAELGEALAAARAAAGPEMVLVAHVTIDDEGSLHDGTTLETYTRFLDASPADVIGLNCSVGPKTTLETLERMMKLSSKPMSAMPNAGHPTKVEGRNIYLSSPEYMAQYARRMLWAGVRIVGGCCGTTPEHIKSMRSEARSLQPGMRSLAVTVEEPKARSQALPKVAVAEKSTLGAKLAAKQFVAFVEILPPRGVDASKEIAGARLCKDAGIDVINVPDGPRASARMSAQVACQLIQRDAGIEAVLHFCCRDRNILGIQSELLGAHAAGVRNLICITGDPPRMGSYPDATAVFDVDSIGLSNIVTNLNSGLDIGGNPIGCQTALLLGVGANPGALNFDEEIRRTEWKVQAGAEYIVTQPVFDVAQLERFLKAIDAFRIPVVAGIWPLTSLRNAEFMINELRVAVPEEFLARMRAADSPERARLEGVEIAREMVRRVRPLVDGVQLSAPFGRYSMAVDVAEAIGPR